ncbi:hypothetical protein ACVTW2_000674 [Escherichia coli]
MAIDNNTVSDVMEISTTDLAAMFSDGFADEEGFKESRDNENARSQSIDDLEMPEQYNEDGDLVSFNDIFDDEESDDVDTVEDLRSANTLDDDALFIVGEDKYEVEEIEKGMAAYKSITAYQSQVVDHLQKLEEAEEGFNRLQSLAYGQIDATIEYWQSVIDSPSCNDTEYRQAMREIKNAEIKKGAIEQQYNQSREVMNQRKREADNLNAMTVRNELQHIHGWGESEFNKVVNYIGNNNLKIESSAVNSPLFLALLKAAAYDEKRNSVKADSDRKVVKALTAKGVTKPVNPATEDRTGKSKAMAKFNRGELAQDEMFNYLDD